MATVSKVLDINPAGNSGYYEGRNTGFDDYLLAGLAPNQPVKITAVSNAFDTVIQVFRADAVGNVIGTPVALNDDKVLGINLNSETTFTPEVGASYIVRVSSINLLGGNYDVSALQNGGAPALNYVTAGLEAGGDSPLVAVSTPQPLAAEPVEPNPFDPFSLLLGDGVMGFSLSDAADSLALSNFPDAASASYIFAWNGDDNVLGTARIENINGNKGNDTIDGAAGGDILRGGKDSDNLFGNSDSDVLNGNNGNDTVDGGTGSDIVRGGKENDLLIGGDGDDLLIGDYGQDSLIGGAGRDMFVFRTDGSNPTLKHTSANVSQVDIIRDFIIGEDTIGLTGLAFTDLSLEAIQLLVNGGAAVPSTAIKINSTGEYLGVVENITPDLLKNPALFDSSISSNPSYLQS
ncbi:calcium-binding protein [Kamptonema formosum]|uniref:calcium-binding protein n=1 Tax=Kamptonema formosum TaxID=331992 RepID=UPI00034B2630|nr:calcium-binding protein [Oscillatoria sp. PCC 10802]